MQSSFDGIMKFFLELYIALLTQQKQVQLKMSFKKLRLDGNQEDKGQRFAQMKGINLFASAITI